MERCKNWNSVLILLGPNSLLPRQHHLMPPRAVVPHSANRIYHLLSPCAPINGAPEGVSPLQTLSLLPISDPPAGSHLESLSRAPIVTAVLQADPHQGPVSHLKPPSAIYLVLPLRALAAPQADNLCHAARPLLDTTPTVIYPSHDGLARQLVAPIQIHIKAVDTDIQRA